MKRTVLSGLGDSSQCYVQLLLYHLKAIFALHFANIIGISHLNHKYSYLLSIKYRNRKSGWGGEGNWSTSEFIYRDEWMAHDMHLTDSLEGASLKHTSVCSFLELGKLTFGFYLMLLLCIVPKRSSNGDLKFALLKSLEIKAKRSSHFLFHCIKACCICVTFLQHLPFQNTPYSIYHIHCRTVQ